MSTVDLPSAEVRGEIGSLLNRMEWLLAEAGSGQEIGDIAGAVDCWTAMSVAAAQAFLVINAQRVRMGAKAIRL